MERMRKGNWFYLSHLFLSKNIFPHVVSHCHHDLFPNLLYRLFDDDSNMEECAKEFWRIWFHGLPTRKGNPQKICLPLPSSHGLWACNQSWHVMRKDSHKSSGEAFKGNLPMMSSMRSWPSLGIEIKAWANMKCELR